MGLIGPFTEGGGLGLLLFGGAGGDADGGQSVVWDFFLLVFSLALVAHGAAAQARGPAYVGFFGLLGFAGLQAAEVNSLLAGEQPDHSLAGWPLLLLLLGGGALLAGMFARPAPPGPPEQETYEVRS